MGSSDPGITDVISLGGRRESLDRTVDVPALSQHGASEFVRPSEVGRYIVLEEVGMGAMGVVCSAYDPKLDRKVALKLLRESDSADARTTLGRARLLREAQALAKLRHPNVVTVHDVDMTENGAVYVAMEYVEGESIDEWLRAHKRGWREVLEVFFQAGEGLAAAHDAGIIHRDFKPGNVRIGADGRVIVLDFGLATRADTSEEPKRSSSSASGEIMNMISQQADLKLTRDGGVVGTPAYMAPEQALGGGAVGPSADQFAFAAAVFEALYGTLPYGEDDMLSVFRRVQLGDIAQPQRDSDVPPFLFRALARALAASPNARWPNMHELLAALRLDPARRRRRIAAIAGACALIGASTASAWVLSSRDQCVFPGDRLAGVWDGAQRELIGSAFAATDLAYAADVATRVSARLDAWAESFEGTWVAVCEATRVRGEQSDALLDARMACMDARARELGALVEVLGEADAAVVDRAIEAAYAVEDPRSCTEFDPAEGVPLPTDPESRAVVELAQAQIDRARARLMAGRYIEAATIASAALTSASGLHTPTSAYARLLLALINRELGEGAKAEQLLRDAALESVAARSPRLETEAWTKLAYLLGTKLERFDEAVSLETVVDVALARAGEPPDLTADVARDRAAVLLATGKLENLEKGEATAKRALALAEAAYGEVDPNIEANLNNIGFAQAKLLRFEEAEVTFRRVVAVTEELYGPDHPRVAESVKNLGQTLLSLEDLDGARALFARSLAIREQAFGPDDVRTAEVRVAIAMILYRRGDLDGADAAFAQAIETMRRADPNHTRVAVVVANRGHVLLDLGRAVEAAAAFAEAERIYIARVGPDHPNVARMVAKRCLAAIELGEWDAAIELGERALAAMMRIHDKPHPQRADAQHVLARALAGAGQRDRAIELARAAVADIATLETAEPNDVFGASFDLARILWDDPATRAEAETILAKLEAEIEATPAGSDLRPRNAVKKWRADHSRPATRAGG